MPDRRLKNRKQSAHPQFQPQGARTSRERMVDAQEMREQFLIVCEGAKTELNYFQGFRVPGRVVEIVGAGRNTLSLVDEAIRLKGEAETARQGEAAYNQVWCVFDRDSFGANDFNSAIRKAEAAGFHVAYTNEAFELWYLLHFDDHRAALHRSQYHGILADRSGHGYQKNSRTMYADLLNRQVEAIRRAESLLAEYGTNHNPQQDNPCTTIHLLVKTLRENSSPRTRH